MKVFSLVSLVTLLSACKRPLEDDCNLGAEKRAKKTTIVIPKPIYLRPVPSISPPEPDIPVDLLWIYGRRTRRLAYLSTIQEEAIKEEPFDREVKALKSPTGYGFKSPEDDEEIPLFSDAEMSDFFY